jgi:hypothetical protein
MPEIMVQLVEFTQKKIRMKQLLVLYAILFLMAPLHLNAQNCVDTVHIKGYYVIKQKADELKPKITRKGNTTTLEQFIDVHYDPSFIPCDSITKEFPLSYWLNHFFDDTKQVFISCEKFGIENFVSKECLPVLENKIDICRFPVLKSKTLYQTTNLNNADVYEIYYIDAFWARVKIKKDSPEADIIPSNIAQRCISPSVIEFDLYYFVGYEKVNTSPLIRDSCIKVWKN